MRNKHLYNSIMNDISKILKKSLYENSTTFNDIDLTPYLDKDGLLDIKRYEDLPQEIIDNLCWEILNNYETIEKSIEEPSGGYEAEADHFFIIPGNNDEDNIYRQTINEYGLTLDFFATFHFEYDPGQEGSYAEFVEPIPDSIELKHVDIEDLKIMGGDYYDNINIDITNKEIINEVSNIMISDMDIVDDWETNCLDNYRYGDDNDY